MATLRYVPRVGLTGGIGSGKSTVAAALALRGAVVVDADRIAREVVEPGRPALAAIAGRFGAEVVGADGHLDRQALATIVFADPAARADLEAITHPAIHEEMLRRAAAVAGGGPVVLDVPLLDDRARRLYALDAVVVVDVDPDVAVSRLVGHRGFTEADARARIAAQMTRADRLALADAVIDNSGDRAALDAEVERIWDWLAVYSAP